MTDSTVTLPQEHVERLIERLSKAQMFKEVTELRAALADPVPPAGGEPDRYDHAEEDMEESAFGEYVTYECYEADVTRLQAEVEVEKKNAINLWHRIDVLVDEKQTLHDELTKALGLLRMVSDKGLLGYMKYDVDEFLSNQSAPADKGQGEPVAWSYCPECVCEELHHEVGEHKQCANCHQEWFSDIDYSDVVRGNLQKLKAERPAPVAVVPEPAFRLLGDGDVIEEGDETLNDDTATWGKQPPGVFLGIPYNRRVMLPVRRAISK